MAERMYIMPTSTIGSWLIPKYCNIPVGEFNPDQLIIDGVDSYCMRPMGFDDWCLCTVVSPNTATLDLIESRGDCFAFPDNLDAVIPSAVVTVVGNRLSQMGVPSNWLTQGITYRQAIREILIVMQLFQEYKGDNLDAVYINGDTSSTRGSQMLASRKARINTIRARRGLSEMANNQRIDDALDEVRGTGRDRNGDVIGALKMKETTF